MWKSFRFVECARGTSTCDFHLRLVRIRTRIDQLEEDLQLSFAGLRHKNEDFARFISNILSAEPRRWIR